MPRNAVKTSYRRVERRKRLLRPSEGVTGPFMRTPTGELSALGRYIESNLVPGMTVHELVEQFQEYDCEHGEVITIGNHQSFYVNLCTECGLTERKYKPGEKPEDG